MSVLGNLGPKLGKLLALLGSDREGEVLAAVEAIRRVLEGAGLDFTDLANGLAGIPVVVRQEQNQLKAGGRTLPTWKWQAREILRVDGIRPLLNDVERGFLRTLSRWHGEPTAKQRAWLERIAEDVLEVAR